MKAAWNSGVPRKTPSPFPSWLINREGPLNTVLLAFLYHQAVVVQTMVPITYATRVLSMPKKLPRDVGPLRLLLPVYFSSFSLPCFLISCHVQKKTGKSLQNVKPYYN